MKRSVADRISDIQQAIERCRQFATFSSSQDPIIQAMANYAIERNLEIIGEAAKHLPSELTNKAPQVEWNAIRGFRNVLAHEYFGIDARIIEAILATQLEELDNALNIWKGEEA